MAIVALLRTKSENPELKLQQLVQLVVRDASHFDNTMKFPLSAKSADEPAVATSDSEAGEDGAASMSADDEQPKEDYLKIGDFESEEDVPEDIPEALPARPAQKGQWHSIE